MGSALLKSRSSAWQDCPRVQSDPPPCRGGCQEIKARSDRQLDWFHGAGLRHQRIYNQVRGFIV